MRFFHLNQATLSLKQDQVLLRAVGQLEAQPSADLRVRSRSSIAEGNPGEVAQPEQVCTGVAKSVLDRLGFKFRDLAKVLDCIKRDDASP